MKATLKVGWAERGQGPPRKRRKKRLTLKQKRARCLKAGQGQAHVRQAPRRGEAVPAQVPAEAERSPRSRRVKPQPVPPPPAPRPSAPSAINSPIAKYTGAFGVRQAERLLWRAGFGPSPGHAQALANLGHERAVLSLTRPAGAPALTGAAPNDGDGPLAPDDAWGHDHLWFLDRMVRTNQPLIERMTLIWHDWFATSADGVEQRYMLDQNALFRRHALGSFRQLALDITADPAMIQWLNQTENTRWNPNENYARELMELFTLGADRGAYTEDDVRELARCLTGWRSDWTAELGEHNFRFDPTRHDPGQKTVFGRTGAWSWEDAVRLCLENPKHPSFVVEKLWSYFIPAPPSASERSALERTYVQGGYAIRPLVEAILMHPQLIAGPRMVKPPVVFVAGMLRHLRRPIDTGAWTWLADGMGQRLFRPPNVAGWDDERWLDTSTLRARWETVNYAIHARTRSTTPTGTPTTRPRPRRPRSTSALAFWGNPQLTPEGRAALLSFATTCLPAPLANWQQTHLPRDAPERAAPARRHVPRPPDELMATRSDNACACTGFSRAQLLRKAASAAVPGAGCPPIEPGHAGARGHRAHPALVHLAQRGHGDGRLRRQPPRAGTPSRRASPPRPSARRSPCSCRCSWTAAWTR